MESKEYEIHTDLACERYRADTKSEGIGYEQTEIGNITVGELFVDNEKEAKAQGIPVGRYTTLFFESLSNMQESEQEEVSAVLAEKLKEYSLRITQKPSLRDVSVLIVGLGNRYITADAVGPLTVKYVTATRHIASEAPELFKSYFGSKISVISPGVMSQTGIESSEIVESVCKKLAPDLVVAIDSLASRSCDRLATTIQLCNTGITPGSGIGNSRETLNLKRLGVPVIAIGVPTVVESSTLVYDAISKAELPSFSQDLEKILKSGKSFFVSPKDSDVVTENSARVISSSINSVFNEGLYV